MYTFPDEAAKELFASYVPVLVIDKVPFPKSVAPPAVYVPVLILWCRSCCSRYSNISRI